MAGLERIAMRRHQYPWSVCVGGGAAHLPRAQVNFFDNAEGYGSGDAEELMGQAITLGIERGYWVREDLVISECGHWGT